MLFMLAENLLEDEKQKFLYLYTEYHQLLLACSRAIVKSESLAEDAVQEAYLRILTNLEKINPEKRSETQGFLVTIVHNTSIDIYNKFIKRKNESLDEILETPQEGHLDPTWEIYDVKSLAEDLGHWIKCLPDEDQLLLLYRFHYGYSYAEIEKILGIKQSTASSRVCRARNKLIAMYNDKEGRG